MIHEKQNKLKFDDKRPFYITFETLQKTAVLKIKSYMKVVGKKAPPKESSNVVKDAETILKEKRQAAKETNIMQKMKE